ENIRGEEFGCTIYIYYFGPFPSTLTGGDRETWGDGEGVDPVGSDGGGDAAAGCNRPAVRVWLRGGSPAVPTAGRAAGDVGHPGVRGGPHRRPRALPPLGHLLRGQRLPLLLYFLQQSGHTAADTSISLLEELNTMVGDLCFLLGSHPCPLMSLTMDWLPLK
ncbi:unnamed protein product, partial [Musa hybrid cultivar]